jgi:hypothetical protein
MRLLLTVAVLTQPDTVSAVADLSSVAPAYADQTGDGRGRGAN